MAKIFDINRPNNKITLGTTGTTINVASHTALTILGLDASKDLESLAIPLIVANGGTGLATITDGGLLLGSGTGAITPLAQATNGQLPIGSTGADCVLSALTGTANQITVTNGAGSITLSLPQNYDTGATPTLGGLTIVNAITEFSTDGTMGGDSDSAVPTEKATKLYTDTLRLDLASTSNAKGASLVGIEDSAAQFDATDVEAALSELIVLVTPVEYNPAMSRTAGGDAGGNDASVATIDDADSYDTDEVSATPGFDIQAVFTGVTDFNQVQIHTAYDGNPAHVVRIDLDKTPFNWSSFDTILADIDDSSGDFVFNAITVASAAQYINSGEVRLRFYHSSAGNATHDFFIDYCALWKTGTSVGVTEHGGLTGLGDDDHLQYIKDSEFTQNSGFLVGTGAGTFQEETGATARTSMGVTIGTNVQAWDAGLDSLAALTYVSDSFIKVTATDTYAIRTIAETADDLEGAIDHDNLANGGAHDYAYITGNDGATGVTAAELEELSDGSETTLHSHAAGGGYQAPQYVDDQSDQLTSGEVYKAITDGSVNAWGYSGAAGGQGNAFIGATNNPTTDMGVSGWNVGIGRWTLSFPVKKDYFWKITLSGLTPTLTDLVWTPTTAGTAEPEIQ